MLNRIVIVGANGFIGKALEARLLSQGFDVLGLTRKDVDLTFDNAAKILNSLLRDGDNVVFLAAITPDKGCDRTEFIQNIGMANVVCSAIEDVAIAHFTYVSSDAVYPFIAEPVEEFLKPSPVGLYGLMHRTREVMCQESVNCPFAILRPTMIYGVEDTHNSYGPNRFRRAASQKGKIELFGMGEEERDFIYIDDIIRIMELVIKNQFVGKLNLATGVSISFADLASKIAGLFNTQVEITHMDRLVPISNRQFDIRELRKTFPELTLTTLDDGLVMAQGEFT